jgi:hypothetical protein
MNNVIFMYAVLLALCCATVYHALNYYTIVLIDDI